tara:strand:- start:6341 stop:8125 length:1785 start_codon:yes stop_codon:yes gene_type:complete
MKNNIYLSILLILSVFFSTLIWNFLIIDFGNTQILGEYFEKKHHALNDPLRYLFFILFPISVYLFFNFFFKKEKLNFDNLKFENVQNNENIKYLFILNLIIISFLFLEFFSIEFPINKIDIYHEGQKLSAPFKSSIDEKLWSGSYVTTGIINENLGIKVIWKILGHQSIGSMRYLQLLYILSLKLSLAFLIYFITKNILLIYHLRLIFYLTSILLTLYLIDYDVGSANSLSYRDLPVLLCLIFFFQSLNNKKNINLSLIFLSFLSITSFFWSVDRAINVNFFIIFMCFFLFLNNQNKKILTILILVLFFWIIFYLYLDNEFKFFIYNTVSVLKNQNYIHGIIHPQPFSDLPNSSRATKSLLLIILSLLISLSFLFRDKIKYSNNLKVIIITLSFVSFCSYLYALGRSDGGHIKQTTGILILFFSTFILFNLLKFLEKFYNSKLEKITILSLIIIFIFNLKVDLKNILNYSDRFNEFVFLEDKKYLSDEQNYLVENITPLLENYDCIQLFTNDSALPYLLKKPNCSKYYFIYSLGSVADQNDLIRNINNTEFIIYRGQTDNWGISPQKKLTIVNNYINSEFLKTKKILDWEIKYK